MPPLRIGQLARLANVNVQTLRFYERKGLLPKPPRGPSGYREYTPDTISVVKFIKRAQELGFSLREIKELLTLRKVPQATCGDVVIVAQRKIEEIEGKINDLRAMQTALSKLLSECKSAAPITQCPIIEALAGKSEAVSPSQKSKNCS